MTDVHDKKTRSFNMSQIKGKNTKPEILVRTFLHQHGFRFRLHVKNLPGKPDIVLPKYKTVIFVHGCFWHGHHNCKYYVVPKTQTLYWSEKIKGNSQRDKNNFLRIRKAGWKVITIFECKLRRRLRESTLKKLKEQLKLQSRNEQ
ncbi:MAG TPA: DNA mismatch endonuclease Vsr [Bacteroidia bacterium]|nr:DNA mismatch endonuclease Vsr [Bacteroidia bacterium]